MDLTVVLLSTGVVGQEQDLFPLTNGNLLCHEWRPFWGFVRIEVVSKGISRTLQNTKKKEH